MGRSFQLIVSDSEQTVILKLSNSPSFTWPFGSTLYLGSQFPSTTQTAPGLHLKNFMFLRYFLSVAEHMTITHNEYLIKRAALFYF